MSTTHPMLFLLHQAVDRCADRTPEHEALRYAKSSLTYAQLADRSDRLARVLFEHGVRRGDRVGIYASKGLEAGVALYGAMKAGAAYVPIDPLAPARRIDFVLRDCGVRHLVSEPRYADTLASLAQGGLELDLVVGIDAHERLPCLAWEDVEHAPQGGFEPGTMEQDLAYVLYTSGSTGIPKGVMHSHRSALAFAEAASQAYGFIASDRLSNHAPLHFDLSTMDYFSSVVSGATTVIIPEAYTKLPASYSQLIQDERLTVVYAVPMALTQLVLRGALDGRDLSSVRWVIFGGEPFPTKHLRSLMQVLPGARFSNIYGPTEVNGVTHWVVPELPDDSNDPIPIGRPFPNVEALVVDEEDRPVAQGDAGELLVRTATMMRGYWRREDLNQRAFFHRPAPGQYMDRFHRTGDLVSARQDGCLMFHGRKDRQIKARGYRVELDGVEAALLNHPDVEVAAAFAVPDANGGQRIEAVATVRDDGIKPSDLLAHASQLLPAYAVPERLEILEQLPRGSTGKIDRLRLSEMAASEQGRAT